VIKKTPEGEKKHKFNIIFIDSKISDGEIGIQAPADANIHFERTEISGNDKNVIVTGYSEQENSSKYGDADRWYKKPIGIVILSVTGGLALFLIGAILRHYFPTIFIR